MMGVFPLYNSGPECFCPWWESWCVVCK